MELEKLKQQVEERKSENQKFRMMELLDSRTEHTNSIQLFNDLIKKIVQGGEKVFCSGHDLLTDSCSVCENDLAIIRI